MRYYLDCEFDGHNGPLLSLALVADDSYSIHIRVDIEPMDIWVRHNVLPFMDNHYAALSPMVYLNDVGDEIRKFIGRDEHPIIIADVPGDIGRFCLALSTGPDGLWRSSPYPRMTFEVHNVESYPTDHPGAIQHNAWWDAKALQRYLRGPA